MKLEYCQLPNETGTMGLLLQLKETIRKTFGFFLHLLYNPNPPLQFGKYAPKSSKCNQIIYKLTQGGYHSKKKSCEKFDIFTIFSRKSDSTITNVCPSVHLSAYPLNSLKSSSFIILHSSYIILYSSFLHFATFKLFSLFRLELKAIMFMFVILILEVLEIQIYF